MYHGSTRVEWAYFLLPSCMNWGFHMLRTIAVFAMLVATVGCTESSERAKQRAKVAEFEAKQPDFAIGDFQAKAPSLQKKEIQLVILRWEIDGTTLVAHYDGKRFTVHLTEADINLIRQHEADHQAKKPGESEDSITVRGTVEGENLTGAKVVRFQSAIEGIALNASKAPHKK